MRSARSAFVLLLAPSLVGFARAAPNPNLTPAPAVVRRVGRVTIIADTRHARPGGLLVARLAARTRLGAVNAILDGRRVPFFPAKGGPRALLPLSVPSLPGPATLGIEILARRSRQRIAVAVEIAPRAYAPRSVLLSEAKEALLASPEAVRDGRRLLQALRGLSSDPLASDRFLAPVSAAPAVSFGGAQTYVGPAGPVDRVEERVDSIAGEYHHGLDYDVPAGTPVRAPAAGRVALVAPLTLSGVTVVIDHGEAVASVFEHLSAADVVEGQALAAGDPVGRSGDSGLAAFPHLHWGTYVHAVPVDPRVFLAGLSR